VGPAAGRLVLVGVSGGIAAYKSCELVRLLRERGAHVVVVMTRAATEFVTPLTFQTLSGNPVVTTLWGDQAPRFDLPAAARARIGGKVGHVDLAEAANAVVIAPATADLIARLVHGEAPDALTTIALACRAPLVVCPAMDLEMWRHAATESNVAALRRRGAIVVGPASGPLASGLDGPGRLAAIEDIARAVERALAHHETMRGMNVLVSAGRTEEAIDPVRVLTNRSSGRMGMALAEAARDRGAEVTLVAGAADVEPAGGVRVVRVRSAAEMARALDDAAAAADVIVMAAAVADYRVARPAREKLKRASTPRTLELEPNPDILAGLGAARRPGQLLIGFALETSDGVRHARTKLAAKNLDVIVLNSPEDAIGRDTNRVILVEARRARRLPTQSKRDIADAILARAIELLVERARPAQSGSRAGTPRRAARAARRKR
jgi:phosphopantothenoylcysteine decarboxylase/phosphopantothenate--cysteine ligase